MERIRKTGLLILLLLVGCSSLPPGASTRWQSPLYVDHELVGMIWDSRRDQFIESAELLTRLDGVNYLLLGEKHDNPDHHALQLLVLEHLLASESVAVVSFEMMSSDQQPLLADASSLRQRDLDEIKDYLRWDSEGWNWDYYGPLVRSALRAGVSINAANISSAEMLEVYGAPTPAEIAEVLDAPTMTALERDIDESHCGMLPESQFPAMVRVQQARDHAMAQSLAALPEQRAQVLIAGNYHIRRDLGVPNYILHARPELDDRQIVSLAFMEVDQDSSSAQDYLQQFGEEKAYDYIWFTPAISDEDYCASLSRE